MEQKKRVLFASMLGNALELYDFFLYIVLAGFLSKVFFPTNNPTLSLMLSFTASSMGILIRPLGAIFFGAIGDRFGRKTALTFSIFLSALPMMVIGLMPSYASIGILSPFLVIIARIAQGLAYGGEYNGAAIFTLEHLSKSKTRTFPGMAGGIISTSSSVGVLLAASAGAMVARFGEVEWAWRVPFILGSLIGLVGFYIRVKTAESPEFLEASKIPQNALSFFQILKTYPGSCLAVFSMGAFVATIVYICVGFLNIYLSRYLHVPLEEAMSFALYGSITCVIACPIFGLISDFVDRRAYFVISTLGIVIAAPIVFKLLQEKTALSIIMAQILCGVSYSCVGGPQHAFIQSLFPVEARYRGIAINYCLGGGILGFAAPISLLYLLDATGDLNSPIYFIAGCAIFFGIALINLGQADNKVKKFDDFRSYSRK